MSDNALVRGRGAAEIKFLIAATLGEQVRAWAREHLAADPHGDGEHGDEYDTTSVYFDTDGLDTFHGRNGYRRSKHRVRRYGAMQSAFLERKTKTRGLVTKRRTEIPLAELDHLKRVPRVLDTETRWSGAWFEARLAKRALRPVCQISYVRTARTAEGINGVMRLTIDDHIRTMATRDATIRGADGVQIVAPNVVLELKYRGEMPALFKKLVEEFSLNPVVTSKYRQAVVALGLAADGTAACKVS